MMTELDARLRRELEHLIEELTVNIPARLGTDQRYGEYQDTIVLQRLIHGRIQHLRRLIAGLERVEPESLPRDAAGFGSVLRVRERGIRESSKYTLMAEEGIDPEAGEVSLGSPMGRALAGRRPGDEVEVAPDARPLRILSLTTLFERLGAHEAPAPPVRLG